jgi:hypothetical protein
MTPRHLENRVLSFMYFLKSSWMNNFIYNKLQLETKYKSSIHELLIFRFVNTIVSIFHVFCFNKQSLQKDFIKALTHRNRLSNRGNRRKFEIRKHKRHSMETSFFFDVGDVQCQNFKQKLLQKVFFMFKKDGKITSTQKLIHSLKFNPQFEKLFSRCTHSG